MKRVETRIMINGVITPVFGTFDEDMTEIECINILRLKYNQKPVDIRPRYRKLGLLCLAIK